jgi:beta-lactamase superfamily II metal-dependent hydrolase
MAGELFFLFFDVQHGHATYIKTPNGKHWFIDLGQGSIQDTNETFSPLLHMHEEYGVDNLDSLVITHPHHDHIADIEHLYVAWPQALAAPDHLTDEEVRGGQKPGEDMEPIEAYLELVKQFDQPVSQATNPRRPANNGGVTVRRFRPKERAPSNLNNHSIVTVLEYAGTKVLIPGDNEAPSWRELLDDPAFVEAITGTDILLAAHHGREAGYCGDIFDHFKPCLTIVSDGPGSDTSAVNKYYQQSTGWMVHSRSGAESEKRYVVTTRSDKAVTVRLIKKDDGSNNVREVTIA